MIKIFNKIPFLCLILCIVSCTKDNDAPDGGNDMIWDIGPTGINIRLIDEEGNNLLDQETEGNWVGEKMTIGFRDKSYSAIWTYDEYEEFVKNPDSRAIMPVFHGLFWTGVLPTVNQKGACLGFGEFDGASNQEMSLTFMIEQINTVFEFKFTHACEWINNEPKISNHITYNGKIIKGTILEIILPKNQN
ncbi:MAG: hypothetical protein K2K45_10475 [Muribaculaceae bacterium]|nr:hypothetical protein [Muribaculaceae bacterium]